MTFSIACEIDSVLFRIRMHSTGAKRIYFVFRVIDAKYWHWYERFLLIYWSFSLSLSMSVTECAFDCMLCSLVSMTQFPISDPNTSEHRNDRKRHSTSATRVVANEQWATFSGKATFVVHLFCRPISHHIQILAQIKKSHANRNNKLAELC